MNKVIRISGIELMNYLLMESFLYRMKIYISAFID